jgi:hypothetical protein
MSAPHVNGVCDHSPMRYGSVLGKAGAVAAVPFERVQTLLTAEGAPILLDVEHRAAGLTVGAEPSDSLVWMHGGFWYQGEYLFAPSPAGTMVTYRIRNISGLPDAAIRLWQRRMLKAQQADLERYAVALPRRL